MNRAIINRQTCNKLESRCDLIEDTLAQSGVPGRVNGGTVTPLWIRYHVLPQDGVTISGIKAAGRALERALDAERVRILARGALVDLEIPRSDPQPIRLERLVGQIQDQIPPMCVPLGITPDGAPLLVQLNNPRVAGNISAPTTFLQVIAVGLSMTHGTSKLRIVTDLPELAELPVSRYAATGELANGLARLVDHRTETGGEHGWIVAILARTGVGSTVLRTGPGVGVHVVEGRSEPGLESRWPLGLTIADQRFRDDMMVAIDRTGGRYTFHPATLS